MISFINGLSIKSLLTVGIFFLLFIYPYNAAVCGNQIMAKGSGAPSLGEKNIEKMKQGTFMAGFFEGLRNLAEIICRPKPVEDPRTKNLIVNTYAKISEFEISAKTILDPTSPQNMKDVILIKYNNHDFKINNYVLMSPFEIHTFPSYKKIPTKIGDIEIGKLRWLSDGTSEVELSLLYDSRVDYSCGQVSKQDGKSFHKNTQEVNFASSEGPAKLKTVIATGVGTDSNVAIKNAIRAAVEEVVGTFISTESNVKNQILLEDKIYTFSEGYVEKMRTISTRTEGGLIYVQIEANIVGTKLKKRLEDLGIAIVKVEGESLFAEAFSRGEEKESKEIIFFKALKKIRKQGLVTQVSKPKLLKSDSGTAEIEVPFSVKWNQPFIENLREALSNIANPSYEPIPWAKCQGICFTKKSLMGQDRVQISVPLLDNSMKFESALILAGFFDKLRFTIQFQDENKQTIWVWNQPGGEKSIWGELYVKSDINYTLITDGVFYYAARVKLETDLLKNIKYARVKFDFE